MRNIKDGGHTWWHSTYEWESARFRLAKVWQNWTNDVKEIRSPEKECIDQTSHHIHSYYIDSGSLLIWICQNNKDINLWLLPILQFNHLKSKKSRGKSYLKTCGNLIGPPRPCGNLKTKGNNFPMTYHPLPPKKENHLKGTSLKTMAIKANALLGVWPICARKKNMHRKKTGSEEGDLLKLQRRFKRMLFWGVVWD